MGAVAEASLGDLGASNPGQRLMVEVADISVAGTLFLAIDDSTKLVAVDQVFMLKGPFERLFFQNTDPNNTVTVEFIATD
jgi:hypothetical protein